MNFIRCIFLILICSCTVKGPSELQQALLFARDNRAELEKVLKRYSIDPADSLKYRAACFLIENMPGYHYYEGEALEKYADYFKLLGEDKKTPDQILDSLHGNKWNNTSIEQTADRASMLYLKKYRKAPCSC
ncbi:hypothetical protein KCV26_12710 [Petrimonas sulfuriphila]|uniref:hypothetical protein n=1 Tax=Petrimonas sulfuriphila TaxID=285070 RepID=UPI003245F27C